jgi:hypothetical protein
MYASEYSIILSVSQLYSCVPQDIALLDSTFQKLDLFPPSGEGVENTLVTDPMIVVSSSTQ